MRIAVSTVLLLSAVVSAQESGRSRVPDVELRTAQIEVESIHTVVRLWMIRNPGGLPAWDDLITPDERGHRYVDLDEPKKDPWGHAYVITHHPDYERMPMVVSRGPDGKEDTEDDITSAPIREKRAKEREKKEAEANEKKVESGAKGGKREKK